MICGLCQTALAQKYESLIELEKKVHAYVMGALQQQGADIEIKVRVSQIDRRLKLATCNKEQLRIFSPYQNSMARSSTVALKCQGPIAWSLFVPVNIKLLRNVVVTNRHIAKGHVFRAEDLQLVKVDTRSLRYGYFIKLEEIVGKLAKRIMVKNKVVNPANLAYPMLIHRGDKVNLIAANNKIKVSVKGVALKGGRIGEFISVKNLTSDRIIEAKVVGKKEVLINL